MYRRLFPLPYTILLCIPCFCSCGHEEAGTKNLELPTVTVSRPLEREVIDYEVYTVPTIEGNNSIDLRARVNGYLSQIEFTPGKDVEKDKLLFVIDQRPYKAALDRAVAAVEAAKAGRIRAKADVERAKQLIVTNAIPKEDYDKYIAADAEAEAALSGANANLEQSKLNMDFTEIRAPIAGRIGRNLIDVGNLVQADTTLLANLVNSDPIYAYFDMPEKILYRLLKEHIEKKSASEAKQQLNEVVVELSVEGEKGFPHKGHLNFLDNKVNPSTGTISIRAEFPNPEYDEGLRELVAGGHGSIRVPLSDPYKALFVHEDAVSNDQSVKIVYTVNDQDVIERKPVELGEIHDGLQAITKGLTPADRVVINGAIRVRPTMKVKVENGTIAVPTLENPEKTPKAEAKPKTEETLKAEVSPKAEEAKK